MKTKEVIKELQKMNLQVEINKNYLNIINCDGRIIACICSYRKFVVDTNYVDFRNLAEDEQEKIYVLLTKLAETDPKDREEEKKYYLKHKWIIDYERVYLNFYFEENRYMLSSNDNDAYFKTKYTQSEIDEIKRKFNTDLEDFELIEVEE